MPGHVSTRFAAPRDDQPQRAATARPSVSSLAPLAAQLTWDWCRSSPARPLLATRPPDAAAGGECESPTTVLAPRFYSLPPRAVKSTTRKLASLARLANFFDHINSLGRDGFLPAPPPDTYRRPGNHRWSLRPSRWGEPTRCCRSLSARERTNQRPSDKRLARTKYPGLRE
jgi:hypothetical protein